MVIFTTLFWRCPTLQKSTLKMKTLLFNVVKINAEIGNVDSTLFNVTNSIVDMHNSISMLIWRYPTFRRHVNLIRMLKQRWNVDLVIFYNIRLTISVYLLLKCFERIYLLYSSEEFFPLKVRILNKHFRITFLCG